MSEPCYDCGAERTEQTGLLCDACLRKWHEREVAELQAEIERLRGIIQRMERLDELIDPH
jgi:NMD protein affecting ribosome stability and mRNA decay